MTFGIKFSSKLITLIPVLVFAVLLINGPVADGHSTDETYIWLNPQQDHYDGRVEIRLPDLRKFLEMEIPEDFESAREAVLEQADMLEEYVRKNFHLKTIDGAEIAYEIVKIDLYENKVFGHFAQIYFKSTLFETIPGKLIVKSTFLFDQDKYSRSLLCMEYSHFTGLTYPESFHHAVFSPWNSEQEIDLEHATMVKQQMKHYVWEGIRHIWIGLDHILFLVTLLLASVLVKRKPEDFVVDNVKLTENVSPKSQWVPVDGFAGAFWNIFKIVTIFTIAHSITLCLASLDIITLPSKLVESIIALSIILVAINNIIPTFRDRTWVILFLFGLFHGLGFASVMQNLPFRMENLTKLLVCFNVGVEIGQLAIVAAVFPVIFFLRKSKYYQPVIMVGGSVLIGLIAGKWFLERALG